MKLYNARPVSLTIKVLLLKILFFFDDWSIHLFQSNQRFQVRELVDRPVPEKRDIFFINPSDPFFSKHAWCSGRFLYVVSHVAILIPSFRGLRYSRTYVRPSVKPFFIVLVRSFGNRRDWVRYLLSSFYHCFIKRCYDERKVFAFVRKLPFKYHAYYRKRALFWL